MKIFKFYTESRIKKKNQFLIVFKNIRNNCTKTINICILVREVQIYNNKHI